MLVYDIEIENSPVKPKKKKKDGTLYKFADGWNDYKGMGITVIGFFDYDRNEWGFYRGDKDSLKEFEIRIQNNKLLIGYNSIGFDNNLLRANGVIVDNNNCYDILREIWFAKGLDERFNYKTHGGYSLDAVCSINLGIKKTGSGADAPLLWQDGEYQQVIDYCMNDIKMTKTLFDKILYEGGLVDPKRNQFLQLAKPV